MNRVWDSPIWCREKDTTPAESLQLVYGYCTTSGGTSCSW